MKSDWIRAMRLQLGIKGFQLAERLGVSAARVSVLEKDETRGAVTLKMMERAAKAMGCRFEYRIVPLSAGRGAECAGNSSDDLSLQSSSKKPRYRVVDNRIVERHD